MSAGQPVVGKVTEDLAEEHPDHRCEVEETHACRGVSVAACSTGSPEEDPCCDVDTDRPHEVEETMRVVRIVFGQREVCTAADYAKQTIRNPGFVSILKYLLNKCHKG